MMTVVKADGYGHGHPRVRPGGARRRRRLARRRHHRRGDGAARGGDTGRLLCWLTVPGEDYAARDRRRTSTSPPTPWPSSTRSPPRSTGTAARVQLKVDTGLSRGGAPLDRGPTSSPRARRGEQDGHWTGHRASGRTSPAATSPTTPPTTPRRRLFDEALDVAAAAGLRPEVRHLANSAAAILRPSSRFDLVRCGIASYGLDPAPGVTPRLGLRPAMTARATLAMTKHVDAGAAVSYGRTWVADHATTLGLVPAGYADGLPRVGGNRAEVWVAGRRRPVRGPDLHGPARRRPRRRRPRRRRGRRRSSARATDGEPTAQDWAEACGTISYEIVTRIGGRFDRAATSTPRRDQTMSARGRILGAVAGAAGLAAAGAALGLARQRRAIGRRRGDATPFGSLRSPAGHRGRRRRRARCTSRSTSRRRAGRR